MNMDRPVDETFCEECYYNNNDNPKLNCKKDKCCYLVRDEYILIDGCVMRKEEL